MAKNPAQKTIKKQDFAVRLSCMMTEAGHLGLYKTMQKLHDAVRIVGWEMCEHYEQEEVCPHCRGDGHEGQEPCIKCRGTGKANYKAQHQWHTFLGLVCCKLCGVVKREDGKNRPCKGIVKMRSMEKYRNE